MRFGVLRTFVAAILVCAVPLRIEAAQSSLPRPQEEIMDLRLDLPGLVGKQNLPGVMNRAVSLNGHYVHDKLVRPTASLARTSSVPTLWLFGENDIRCGSPLSRQRHQPFTAASEITEHKWLPPVREHSDFLVHSVDATALSAPLFIGFSGKTSLMPSVHGD
jgi:hypothetical protein